MQTIIVDSVDQKLLLLSLMKIWARCPSLLASSQAVVIVTVGRIIPGWGAALVAHGRLRAHDKS